MIVALLDKPAFQLRNLFLANITERFFHLWNLPQFDGNMFHNVFQ